MGPRVVNAGQLCSSLPGQEGGRVLESTTNGGGGGGGGLSPLVAYASCSSEVDPKQRSSARFEPVRACYGPPQAPKSIENGPSREEVKDWKWVKNTVWGRMWFGGYIYPLKCQMIQVDQFFNEPVANWSIIVPKA